MCADVACLFRENIAAAVRFAGFLGRLPAVSVLDQVYPVARVMASNPHVDNLLVLYGNFAPILQGGLRERFYAAAL